MTLEQYDEEQRRGGGFIDPLADLRETVRALAARLDRIEGVEERRPAERTPAVRVRRPRSDGARPGLWGLDVVCPACGRPMRLASTRSDGVSRWVEVEFVCQAYPSQSAAAGVPPLFDGCSPGQRLTVRWAQTPDLGSGS